MLGATNAAAFLLYGADKAFAKLGWRRVSERTLLTATLPGSAPGAWLGMAVFRHKTQKARFRWGVPLIAIVEVGLAVWLVEALRRSA